MGLTRALETLPDDRATKSTVREALLFFQRHEGEWIDLPSMASMSGISVSVLTPVVTALAACFVLDFDDGRSAFRYGPDSVRDLEIDNFLHRVEAHDGLVKDNLARFRRRYGY